MHLSFLPDIAGVDICRDGPFQNLGFLADQRPSMLSFLESERFLPSLLRNDMVSAVVTTQELAAQIPPELALAVCAQPRISFAKLHNHLAATGFYWDEFPTSIHPQAEIHPRAWVAEKNVTIGPNSVVGPNATILERCMIGANVTVGAGAVLGGVGFQTARTSTVMLEMRHAGGLKVGDGAHILHGAVIANGLFRNNTEVGCEARVGAQVFLSHGVQLGDRAFIGHGSVLNGNVVIGSDAWIGPGAVIAQNLYVGSGAFVSLGSVVVRNVEPKKQVSGNFAISHRRLLRHLALIDAPGDAA